MKKTFLAYALGLLAAVSCSTTSRVSTLVFDDGLYSGPVKEVVPQAPTSEELDNLLADSHSSQAYILSAGDTLVVPEGKKIRFDNSETVVTIWDTPAWLYDYSWAYRPGYMRDFYYGYWSFYDPWYYRPWRYGYSAWYWDPWYYDSWYYGPHFNYTFYGIYSPWYRYHYYDSWYWNRFYPGHYAGYYWTGPIRPHRSHAAHMGHRVDNFSARGAASHSTVSRGLRGGSARSSALSRATKSAGSSVSRSGASTRSSSVTRSAGTTRSAGSSSYSTGSNTRSSGTSRSSYRSSGSSNVRSSGTTRSTGSSSYRSSGSTNVRSSSGASSYRSSGSTSRSSGGYSGGGSIIYDVTYDDSTYNLVMSEPYGFIMYNVNGTLADFGYTDMYVSQGDLIKVGNTDCATMTGDPYDWTSLGYAWETPIVPVTPLSAPDTTPVTPLPEEATIAFSDILYWVGEGSNEAVMAVNWADTALAWGYRWNGTATVADMMADIAAADPRFSYELGNWGLDDILFAVAEGDTLRKVPYSYWESKNNGMMDAGMSQTLANGDFEKWAEPAAGVVVDSMEYSGVWYYTYAYPMTIYPVSVPDTTHDGIDNHEMSRVHAYPNPCTGTLYITNDNAERIELYNANGKLLEAVENRETQVILNMQQYPAGLYLLKVGNGVQKILKK